MKMINVDQFQGEGVLLGRCTSPFGLHGGLRAFLVGGAQRGPYRDFLWRGKKFWCFPGGWRELNKAHWGPKGPIFYFREFSHREGAQGAVPFDVFSRCEDLPFPWGLLGHEAFEAQSGERLGRIEAFYSNGPQEVAVIPPWEIPFVPPLVKGVDNSLRKVDVFLPRPV